MQRRRIAALCLSLLLLALIGATERAAAQAYPSKPVRIIVPFPPGGGTDTLARIIQPVLQEKLGQPIIVENKAGATGAIGTEFAINQPKDGYTVVVGSPAPVSVAPALNRQLAYNPQRDLVAITMGVVMPNLLVAHPSVKAATVQELLALARAEPGKLAFSSGGIGSNQQLSGELLKIMAKVDLLHVPYKGSAPAVADVVAGQVQLSFTDPSVLEQVRAGKLRLLAQTSEKRSPLYPDVPTIAEQGFPGFNAVNWYGFFVATGTPAEAVERLNRDIVATLNVAEIKAKLVAAGMNPEPGSPAELKAFVEADTARWADVIKAANIKVE